MTPKSIPQLFFDACDTFDKRDAVLVKKDGAYKGISHRFFRQRVRQFARGLLGLGLEAGDKVGLLCETRFEWAIADLGITCVGGVDVTIYPTLLAKDILFILQNSEATGLVLSSAEQMQKIMEIRGELPQLKYIICIDEISDAPDGVLTMAQVEQQGSQLDNEHDLEARYQAIGHADLLTLIYTSGTTGKPKGVMLTHGNLLANVKSCEPYMPCGTEDIHLSHLPLSHVLERMGGYYVMLRSGVTIAYAEDMKKVPENIREVRPTILVSVPRLFEKIYAKVMSNAQTGGFLKRKIFSMAMGIGKQAVPFFNRGKELGGLLSYKWNMADKLVYSKVKEATGGRLKYMVSGGAPLSREVAELFLGMGLSISEGYGLTETSPVVAINRVDNNKPGTVGLPVDDVEIKIAEDGEILVKGPNVMVGYYNNPEATAKVLADGWFHTGDIGVIDEEGFLRITDRKKDLLVTSGGKNIAPQPLENALKLSPLIEQAVVLGDKRNFISALLVPPWETVEEWASAKGWPTDPLQLVEEPKFLSAMEAEVKKQMEGFAHFEQVKEFRVIPRLLTIEHNELTPSLKIRRRNINENFKELISSIYPA